MRNRLYRPFDTKRWPTLVGPMLPVIAALGGVLFLGEALTFRAMPVSVSVLGSVALVILE